MKLLKSYNFWIRLIAVVVLLLRVIGSEFGLSIDSGLIIDLATAIASVLVVLGVIQVPVDSAVTNTTDGTNNGGEDMNSIEKIKEDIILAKDKLLTNFEDSEILTEITGILDNILGTSIGEEITKMAEEGKAQAENLETIVIETERVENSGMNSQSETNGWEEVLEPTSAIASEEGAYQSGVEDVEVESEISSVDAAGTTTVEENAEVELTDETQAKLNQLLRAKIFEVLERDLDDIIKEIS